MKKDYDAILIAASSQKDADMLYATGFWREDEVFYIETNGKKILVLPPGEIERAKQESKLTEFLSEQKYRNKLRALVGLEVYKNLPSYLKGVRILDLILKELKIKSILVPRNFPFGYGQILEKIGYKLSFGEKEAFFEKRKIKTGEEINYIKAAVEAEEEVLRKAINLIKNTQIKNGLLISKGRVLTAKAIQRLIEVELLKKGYRAKRTIVSCGKESSSPHLSSRGLLKANEPIVIDLFPRSISTGYFADITRTVVKGKASKELKKMYEAVLGAQKMALGKVREGAFGNEIDEAVNRYFENQGFKTCASADLPYGFIHTTGHGLGLEVHEQPTLSSSTKEILTSGNVITIEPGLYYPDIGGVRIEDLVVVTKDGCENLTKFEKEKFEL